MSSAGTHANSRKRQRAIFAVCALLLAAGVVVYTTWMQHATQPITISDANKVVTINLPPGWVNNTASDAGQISTVDNSGDTVQAYRVPDVAAYFDTGSDDSPSDPSQFDVTIGIPAYRTSHQAQHRMQVGAQSQRWDRAQPGATTATTISGRPALRTVINADSNVIVVTTLLTDDYLITINAYANRYDQRDDRFDEIFAGINLSE